MRTFIHTGKQPMAEEPEKKDGRELAQSPRVTLVGTDRLRVEFKIEELMSALLRGTPSGVTVASCSGCKGCAA